MENMSYFIVCVDTYNIWGCIDVKGHIGKLLLSLHHLGPGDEIKVSGLAASAFTSHDTSLVLYPPNPHMKAENKSREKGFILSHTFRVFSPRRLQV